MAVRKAVRKTITSSGARDKDPAFFEDPAHSVGHLARTVFRHFVQALEIKTRPFGVTSGQWGFLRVLWIEEGLTQRELSRRVGKREPTTVSALRSLEQQGLVIRRPCTADKRHLHVYLTPKARALKRKLLPFVAELNAQALQGLSKLDRDNLRKLLVKVATNLSSEGRDNVEISHIGTECSEQ